MAELMGNQILLTAVAANLVAQLFKALIVLLIDREWRNERLFGPGGMPSSHSSFVTALATGVAAAHGTGSALFAVSAVFALIVMYDACGIRRAAGKQAHLLNELVEELRHVLDDGFRPQALKTVLGHSCLQVFAGMVLGISAGILSFTVWPAY
jgi:uncharacterized protein